MYRAAVFSFRQACVVWTSAAASVMSVSNPSNVRAERLRVVLALCDGMPYIDPREAAQHGLPPSSPAEVRLLEDVTEADLALVNACLEIEQELRQRTYAAAERVLAYAAGGSGKLDKRILTLPEREAIRAMCDLYELGWIYDSVD
jgi:hypothetical protein